MKGKKIMKKTLAIILTLAVMLAVLPFSMFVVSAAETSGSAENKRTPQFGQNFAPFSGRALPQFVQNIYSQIPFLFFLR